jgi:NhaP-type Na+/H+ or K+/H+ antiporter
MSSPISDTWCVWRGSLKAVAFLAVAAAVFEAAEALAAEPLLACVATGLVVANRRGEGGGRDTHDDVAGGLGALMPSVNVLFFGLVGASIKLVRVARVPVGV